MVNTSKKLKRRDVVKQIVQKCSKARIISGLGSPTYDLHNAGDNDRNFYLWGAMGGAAMTGLGLALAKPDLPVIVITGDGEQLMGIGSLATIGVQQPKNLALIVLDNGYFGETGMQKSHTSNGVDLKIIAQGSKFKHSYSITNQSDLQDLLNILPSSEGPLFVNVKVDNENLKRSLPILDGVELKNRFRRSLGLDPN